MVAIVTQGRRGPHPVRAQLLALPRLLLLLPLILAMPLRESLGGTSWTNAYFNEDGLGHDDDGLSVYTAAGRSQRGGGDLARHRGLGRGAF